MIIVQYDDIDMKTYRKEYDMRNSTFKKRLRIMLDDYGYSQKDFALMSGLTEAAISKYLSGVRVPNEKAIVQIADASGVSPSWLLGYGPDKPIERI